MGDSSARRPAEGVGRLGRDHRSTICLVIICQVKMNAGLSDKF